MARVVVALAGERPPVGQPEIALRPLQRLDRRLLVDPKDDGVVGRRHIQPDDLGGLGDKFGIVALAPRLLPVQIDPLVAQEAPHLLLVNVAKRTRREAAQSSSRIHRAVADRASRGCASARQDRIWARHPDGLSPSSPARRVARVAHPPFRRRSGGATHDPTDLRGLLRLRRPTAHPSAVAHPNFRLRRTAQLRKNRPFLASQSDRGRARNGSHPQSELRLVVQR